VLQRKVRGRVEFTNSDRLFFIQLYRWFPSILKAITTFRPETLVRWHRAGFRRYWRWKSRNLGGRPQIAVDLRALIRFSRSMVVFPSMEIRTSGVDPPHSKDLSPAVAGLFLPP